MTKSLLLKGLAGVAAVGGVVAGGAVYGKDLIFGGSGNKPGEALKAGTLSHKELIDKAGLDCGLTGKELKESEEKECSVKSEGTITVKVDSQTEEGVTFTTSDSAKLKVRRSKEGEDYNRGLKFVVDSGDITLSKKTAGSSPTTITKLEQFETYEIKEEEGKYSLSRKTKADVGIKNALGLGSFSLPTAGGEGDRSFNDAGEIKKIRFEGHSEGITVSSGSITLKVSKTVDTTTFPFGYRFNFTFPQEITINGKQLKGKIPYEFKIKKGTGNSLTLEQAWTDDNVFTKKAGLSCGTNNECTVSSTESQKLNVKVGHQKKEGITTVSTGKIKVEKEQEGYNQGLKFSITDGGVTFSGGTGDDITKLEELETYEIAEDGGKYYLTKKTSPDQLIKTSLVLPGDCELPKTDSPVSCTLSQDAFKAINFEGKGNDASANQSVTLTISKANSTDFPFGYKFTFKTETEATVTSTNKIKAKIPKDFKIKKGSGSGTSVTLSLEKAWDDSTYSLAKKVGLTCTTSSGTECTMSTSGSPTVKLNVKKGSDVKEGIDTVTLGSGKIKVEKDQEGYNQGLKFTITTADVTLSGGSSAGGKDFSSLEELETYEITEDKGKYYLTRKTSKEDVLKTSLSIPEGCFTSLGTSCELTSEDFKKISFDNKDTGGSSLGSGTATLTITKADSTDFPLGYRFTFNTTAEATIKTGTTTIKAKIPTDFKVKKVNGSGQTPTTLTLEKAWNDNDYSFAKKAGLQCTSGNGECCSQVSGTKINVKKGADTKTDIDTVTTTGSGKIKVEKEQAGYNQGLKFTITGGDVSLTGGNKAQGSNNEITTLDEYETYEITEEGGKYYLTRKDEAIKTIESQLGLGEAGCSLSSSSSCTLDTNKIKKINFDGKDTSGATLASGTATLTISKTDNKTDFPLGYKFTLKSTSGDINIKNSSNVVKKGISTDFKIKKNSGGQSPSLSLEKAWTADGLGKKVGLTCNNGSGEECSIDNSSGGKIKVRQNNNGQDIKDENLTKKSNGSSGSAKIKVTKDQEGYNQGFKFTVEGGSIELDGSTASYAGDKINILDEYETYEIKEHSGKWYLTRKQESIIFIKKQLGLDFCTDNSWSRLDSEGGSGSSISLNCNIGSVDNLKSINFHNKSTSHTWPTGKIDLLLQMKKSRNNNENFGEWEVTISDNRDSKENTTSVCIPDGAGGKIDIKGSGSDKTGAKYKIKKNGGGGTGGSLCLEKSGSGSSGQCK